MEGSSQPKILTCLRALPNPFHDRVNINFRVNQPGEVNLKIYGASGRLVTSHKLSVTSHCFIWESRDNSGKQVSPGVYFIHLETDNFKQIEKVILSR